MIARHNRNEWADHKKETIRPSYEKIKLEIFSFEHRLTQKFYPAKSNIKGTNLKKVNHRSLKCLESKDKETSFIKKRASTVLIFCMRIKMLRIILVSMIYL